MMLMLRFHWLLKLNSNKQLFNKYSTNSIIDEFIEHTNRHGYKGENYEVKTNDGYHLKLHKICGAEQKLQNKRNVFLMHGLARHSMDYLASGRQVSLAYYLADYGFDVWLGNSRDTKMCFKHDNHPLQSKEFLNYNLHDIGIYDIRALLEFVLNQTSESTISYVGHSQGAGTLLILLSTMPEFNSYINEAHLLTPAVFLKEAKSPILTLSAKYHKFTNAMYDHFEKINISPILEIAKDFNKVSSDEQNIKRARIIYDKLTCWIVGKNNFGCEISEEALTCFQDLMTPYWSTTHLRHFLQLHMTGKFQQFDFGRDKNLKIYNSPYPPEYNLQNVTAPIYLYSASEDLLVAPRDVEKLKNLLPNVKCYKKIEDWNHMDVLLSKNARKVIYENIVESLNEVK